jgi:hypothetical protein
VILIPALIGAIGGAAAMWMMFTSGMLRERSGLAVLLAAIAFFYPVFAVQSGDYAEAALHGVIFAGFTSLALLGFNRGANFIAGGLIAHGVFDLGLIIIGGPGPVWWPVFCGTLDIAAGLVLIRLLQNGKVPR